MPPGELAGLAEAGHHPRRGIPRRPARQAAAPAAITQRLTGMPEVPGALVLRSMAVGMADAASDTDLIACAHPGRSGQAWRLRNDLHATGALICWDDSRERDRGRSVPTAGLPPTSSWPRRSSQPGSSLRLAGPWKVIAGDASVARFFPARPRLTEPGPITQRASCRPRLQRAEGSPPVSREVAANNATAQFAAGHPAAR